MNKIPRFLQVLLLLVDDHPWMTAMAIFVFLIPISYFLVPLITPIQIGTLDGSYYISRPISVIPGKPDYLTVRPMSASETITVFYANQYVSTYHQETINPPNQIRISFEVVAPNSWLSIENAIIGIRSDNSSETKFITMPIDTISAPFRLILSLLLTIPPSKLLQYLLNRYEIPKLFQKKDPGIPLNPSD